MKIDASRPRLLLASSLLCTFSLVAVIGYHASLAPADASVGLPGTVRAAAPSAGPAQNDAPAQTASGAGAPVTADSSARHPPSPGYTLNPHGPGLLPTAAPGSDTFAGAPAPAEGAEGAKTTTDPQGDNQAAAADRGASKPFRMPGARRPASAGPLAK